MHRDYTGSHIMRLNSYKDYKNVILVNSLKCGQGVFYLSLYFIL